MLPKSFFFVLYSAVNAGSCVATRRRLKQTYHFAQVTREKGAVFILLISNEDFLK